MSSVRLILEKDANNKKTVKTIILHAAIKVSWMIPDSKLWALSNEPPGGGKSELILFDE